MDTSESYSRGGTSRGGGAYQGRGGGYQGGGYQDYNRGYEGGGGRGGGRGRGQYYQDREYQDSRPPARGWNQPPRDYHNDFYRGGGQSTGGGGRGRGRNQSWGRDNRSNYKWERDKQGREEETLAQDVAALTELTGHTQKVTAIFYDSVTQQIYTGSGDGTVRAWSIVTGQCADMYEVGGEVDSLHVKDGYLFVGMHKGGEGIIKVWHIVSKASHLLTGHKGAVLTLCIANAALVSAGQDHSIRVWPFNPQAGIFMSQHIITQEEGGHSAPVHALCVMGAYMFSADRVGNIIVWELASGKVAQRLPNAHGNSPIMQLLPFGEFLLSAGMDGLIRAWQVMDGQPGMVLRPDAEYVFDKDDPDTTKDFGSTGGVSGGIGWGQRRPNRERSGIITMSGTTDATSTPVLMVAYNSETCIRLYQLPDFSPRGVLTPASDTRSLASVAGMVMLAGDVEGKIRVFQWKAPAVMPLAT